MPKFKISDVIKPTVIQYYTHMYVSHSNHNLNDMSINKRTITGISMSCRNTLHHPFITPTFIKSQKLALYRRKTTINLRKYTSFKSYHFHTPVMTSVFKLWAGTRIVLCKRKNSEFSYFRALLKALSSTVNYPILTK